SQSLCDYFGIPLVAPTAVRWGTVITDGSGLNIRKLPDISSAVIGSIPNDATVMINGQVDGWYVVNYNGTIGYSSSEFIYI
ncbi:MAG: SH3 domain-containing protein, partial [Ruminococcus sp.]|nr:SH3 domain-containing protein [Ruminococcus sp.]